MPQPSTRRFSTDRHEDGVIRATASRWLARYDRGLRPGERAKFAEWLASDSRHAPALMEFVAVWRRLNSARRAGRSAILDAAIDRYIAGRPHKTVTARRPVRTARPLRAPDGLRREDHSGQTSDRPRIRI